MREDEGAAPVVATVCKPEAVSETEAVTDPLTGTVAETVTVAATVIETVAGKFREAVLRGCPAPRR
ncbi:MAG: hypothetical protein AB1486_15365 [Planctomycetota bacterium]